ncbi:dual specificity protein phosphatase 6-like [Clytia hemisphaerica]|uniref:dual specificity protein phosphatase 6-like n=1 Tax=Clytia hemisphaerica TaxID=252671 RepID=UPI0034D62FD9
MNSEDVQWLHTQTYQFGEKILIIDCRTLNEYSKGHIEGAINLFVPSLMLRRLKKGNVPLKNFVNSDIAKEKFENRSSCDKIVLYDESSTTVTADSILEILSKKLLDAPPLVHLKGGFHHFEQAFPHLCTCGEGNELNNAMFSLSNLSLDPALSADTIPSPMLDVGLSRLNSANNAKDLLFRPDSSGPIEIVSNLFLGNKVDASSLDLLRKARITHILNVTPDLPNDFTEQYQYLRLAVKDDWTGYLADHFAEAYDFIDKAIKENGRVLVHCVGGISRSSTIIIAYLMLKYDYSLNKAFDMVKIKKTNIAPNFNFMGQLLELERKRQDSASLYPPGSISPGSSSISSEISTTSC